MTEDTQIEAPAESSKSRQERISQTQSKSQDSLDEFNTWSAWLSQAAEAGSTMAELFASELRLAMGDAARMLFLALIAVPVAFLTWIGLATLLAWGVAHLTGSTGYGLAAFVMLHLAILVTIQQLWRRYKRSLSLPLTRQHLHAFMGGVNSDETQTPDP